MSNFLKVILIVSILIISIICSGIFTNHILNKDSKIMEDHITQMEIYVKNRDWLKAEEELEHIREYWSQVQSTWAMLQSHFEMDNIDSTLTKVSEFTKTREFSLTLAEASLLKQYIKHIPEKVAFNLENIL